LAWVESVSASFHARHDDKDADDAARVLEQLERDRERLAELFPRTPGELTVVLHDGPAALALAQPYLLVARALTAPAGRRYQAGWYGSREIHVLAPRALEERASGAEGSREALLLTPSVLYAAVAVGANNPELPPPFTPGSFARLARWAWLAQGAAQYFGRQVPHLRPAIARRLREGGSPSFPPSARDAALLGGTVFDLLAREEGDAACARLVGRLHPQGATAWLERAFDGRRARHTEGTWRTHLARLAGAP
jgi:hypothetical protein